MESTKYLILFLTVAAVSGLCGCMGGEKEGVLENVTNDSAAVNAAAGAAVNATAGAAVNTTPPAITNATAANVQTIGQMVQIKRIGETASMDPGIGLFESNIVFEVKNIWDKDIDRIEVSVLEKECVGEQLMDFGSKKFHTFTDLTSGEREEFTLIFRKFEGFKSGQKFTCPMSISILAGAEETGNIIYFDVIVP